MRLDDKQFKTVTAGINAAVAAFEESCNEPGPSGDSDKLQSYKLESTYHFTDTDDVHVSLTITKGATQ